MSLYQPVLCILECKHLSQHSFVRIHIRFVFPSHHYFEVLESFLCFVPHNLTTFCKNKLALVSQLFNRKKPWYKSHINWTVQIIYFDLGRNGGCIHIAYKPYLDDILEDKDHACKLDSESDWIRNWIGIVFVKCLFSCKIFELNCHLEHGRLESNKLWRFLVKIKYLCKSSSAIISVDEHVNSNELFVK